MFANSSKKAFKQLMPLYLVEPGMVFRVGRYLYTLVCDGPGLFEARDKFGLIVLFSPCTRVYV